MTRDEAEELLNEWVTVTRDRDNRVRAAVGAGVSKHRVFQLTGISRTTIDRIMSAGASNGPAGASNDH